MLAWHLKTGICKWTIADILVQRRKIFEQKIMRWKYRMKGDPSDLDRPSGQTRNQPTSHVAKPVLGYFCIFANCFFSISVLGFVFVKLITSTITTPSHWWCFDVSYHCVVLVSFHSLDLRIWSKYKNFPNFRKIFTSLVAEEVHAEKHCRASKGCLAEQSLPTQAELLLLYISGTSTSRFLRRKYWARTWCGGHYCGGEGVRIFLQLSALPRRWPSIIFDREGGGGSSPSDAACLVPACLGLLGAPHPTSEESLAYVEVRC